MRDLKLIKRCLIVLALVWAQIPVSVLAEPFRSMPSCDMKCCRTKVIQPIVQDEPSCNMCPAESMAETTSSNTLDKQAIAVQTGKDSCPCKLAPRSLPAEHANTAYFKSSSNTDQTVHVCWVPIASRFEGVSLTVVRPGIVGTDSGPPAHRPNCGWLGRAPPFHVA